MPAGLYLHIPFCRVRCPYCSFNVFAGLDELIPDYLARLPAELDLRLGGRAVAADTLYLGGGTPSLLTPAQVDSLLRAVAERVGEPAEITLEVDPGSADRERLAGFRAAGVTRVTVGVQTFSPRLLGGLGRAHTVADAVETLEDLRSVGFDDLNIDLMFGLPGQCPRDFDNDLARALAYGPTHLSLYNLTIEPGTEFAVRERRGDLPLPPEDDEASMYRTAVERTRAQGLDRYEVSNFARPGRESRHNRKHWFGHEYIGLGAGAHGFHAAAGRRWWNLKSPRKWMRAIDAGVAPEAGAEMLGRAERLAEAILLGLRTVQGLNRARFQSEFEVDPGASMGWAGPEDPLHGPRALRSAAAVTLTDTGFLVADHLAERLLRSLDPPGWGG